MIDFESSNRLLKMIWCCQPIPTKFNELLPFEFQILFHKWALIDYDNDIYTCPLIIIIHFLI